MCTEALWYGVPTVAIPQATDPPALTEIRDAILEVAADPQIRLRLATIREELHGGGSPGHAADAVEDVATGRR